jgi:hypothetical protein
VQGRCATGGGGSLCLSFFFFKEERVGEEACGGQVLSDKGSPGAWHALKIFFT